MRSSIITILVILSFGLLNAQTPAGVPSRNQAAVDSLVRLLADEDLYRVGEVAGALGRIGAPAVSALTTAMQDQRAGVRWAAAIALGKMGPAAAPAVEVLTKGVDDPDENVRWCSFIALGNIGPTAKAAVPALMRFRSGRDDQTQWGATYALMHIDRNAALLPPQPESVQTFIREQLPTLMERFRIPGVSVVLVKDGKVDWSQHSGTKDVRSMEPVGPTTMFEACSMSKPVFACVVMYLVQQRKLDLDRPLEQYLKESFPSIIPYRTKLTARMVLSHTSGMPNWRTGDEETDGPLPLYHEPGSRFGYSGEAMFYLQRVVERITGEPLNVFAQRIFFGPMGLSHIGYVWEQRFDTDIAAGHDTSGAFRQRTKYLHPNSAYSLYTSAEDYARFTGTILSGKGPLTAGTVKEMLRPHTPVDVREPIPRPGRAHGLEVSWGLGWAVDTTISGTIVYHSGANRSGFRCYVQFRPGEGSGIVIMTNGLNGSEFWRSIIARIGDY